MRTLAHTYNALNISRRPPLPDELAMAQVLILVVSVRCTSYKGSIIHQRIVAKVICLSCRVLCNCPCLFSRSNGKIVGTQL